MAISIRQEDDGYMEKVEGYVEHIVYRSEETGYTVMEISSSD